jgi:5'-deoxy-5'-methylthioadenosine phosphorylase
MLAIIGGSGLTQLANLEATNRKAVRTPYGEPSGAITFGTLRGRKVMFLARHGYGHTIPPHEVNYRANIWALHEEGASGIVSVASVGGIRDDLAPGALVVPHQVIDYTWGRRSTFFEGGDVPVTHVDFTEPFSPRLRTTLFDAARACGESLVDGAVYACTQGPRLESAAEVERLARDGADLVGMTGMPEAALARELDFEYATIAVVVNHAAGRGDSVKGIKFEKLEEMLQQSMGRVRKIIEEMAQRA